MSLYNGCQDIYDTNLTANDLLNVQHCTGISPYGDYNALGQLQGYYWHYGDTVNLTFHLDGEISVESDAILYTGYGEEPTEQTVGTIGQRAYNVLDLVSWTCDAIIDGKYIWNRDSEFIYPEDSARKVYMTASDFLHGKQASVTIYNFRYEPFYSKIVEAKDTITISIDKETSKMFTKGTYYLTLQIFDDSSLLYIPVIKGKDCAITVR